MKTQFNIAVIAMAFVTLSASPNPETVKNVAQQTKQVLQQAPAGFGFFRVHRQGKDGVTTTWGMGSETGITGYVVQRTYSDPSDPYGWENVCAMACNGTRSYKWTDEGIFPGFISYRIVATMSGNGSEIVSDVETIHIMGH